MRRHILFLAAAAPLAPPPSASGAQELDLLRSYPLEAPPVAGGSRAALACGDLSGDGLEDLVHLFRSATGGTPLEQPGFQHAAHANRSGMVLPETAADVAVDLDVGAAGLDLLYTVRADVLTRWGWTGSPPLAPPAFVPEEELTAPWEGEELTAVDAGGAPGLFFRRVVVASTSPSGDHTIHPLVFLQGSLFSVGMPFPASGRVGELLLVDFDGDGDRGEIAALSTDLLEVFAPDGTVLHVETASASTDHVAVIPADAGGGTDRLALVTGSPGNQELRVLHPIEAPLSVSLSTWKVTGVAAGDVTGDGLADVVVGRSDPPAVELLVNEGWFDPFDLTKSVSMTIVADPGTPVHPSLYDHDHDCDLDLAVVTDGELWMFLGTDQDQSELSVSVFGNLLNPFHGDVLQYVIHVDPPPGGLPANAQLAYRVYRQPYFDPELPVEHVGGDVLPMSGPLDVVVDLELIGEYSELNTTVFFLQFYVVDPGPPQQALPLSAHALTIDDDQEVEICDYFDSDEDCKPRMDIGIIRIDFVPPPIPLQ